jgi:hypothetical protein
MTAVALAGVLGMSDGARGAVATRGHTCEYNQELELEYKRTNKHSTTWYMGLQVVINIKSTVTVLQIRCHECVLTTARRIVTVVNIAMWS